VVSLPRVIRAWALFADVAHSCSVSNYLCHLAILSVVKVCFLFITLLLSFLVTAFRAFVLLTPRSGACKCATDDAGAIEVSNQLS
jgi:hypothetical protein